MDIYIVDDSFVIEKKVSALIDSLNQKKKYSNLNPIIVDYPQRFYEKISQMEIKDNDIFILDIDLNAFFTGIDIGETIRSKNSKCYILYLTGLEDNAISIINKNIYPWAYIVKEIDNRLFNESLTRTLEEIVLHQMKRQQSSDFTSFSVQNKQIVIPVKDIIYLKSINGYKNSVLVKTMDEDLIVDGTLKKFKNVFYQPFFFRGFRAYIINLNTITEWSREEQYVGFANGDILELGVKSIDKLKKAITEISY